jgi:hypothetical protein
MKFLDQIAELEAKAAGLSAVADNLSDVIGAATRQLGELQQALANAPTPFTVKVQQNGQDFAVCEKDGLVLFAALVRTLEGEEVEVRLAGGQTPKLRLTDLEQIASKILEATK